MGSRNMSAQLSCPVCGKAFASDDSNAMPFCSERCRMVDLSRWMNEEYGLPHVPDPDDDETVDETG